MAEELRSIRQLREVEVIKRCGIMQKGDASTGGKEQMKTFKLGDTLRLRKLLPHARNPADDVIMVERDGVLFRMGAKYVCIPGDPSKTPLNKHPLWEALLSGPRLTDTASEVTSQLSESRSPRYPTPEHPIYGDSPMVPGAPPSPKRSPRHSFSSSSTIGPSHLDEHFGSGRQTHSSVHRPPPLERLDSLRVLSPLGSPPMGSPRARAAAAAAAAAAASGVGSVHAQSMSGAPSAASMAAAPSAAPAMPPSVYVPPPLRTSASQPGGIGLHSSTSPRRYPLSPGRAPSEHGGAGTPSSTVRFADQPNLVRTPRRAGTPQGPSLQVDMKPHPNLRYFTKSDEPVIVPDVQFSTKPLATTDATVKILMIGNSSVGKSVFCQKVSQNDDSYDPTNLRATVGVEMYSLYARFPNRNVKILLMDTQGSDNTMTVISSYFRRAHAYILMCDVTDRQSFENLERWHDQAQSAGRSRNSYTLLCDTIIANKVDKDIRQYRVRQRDAFQLESKYDLQVIPCSALSMSSETLRQILARTVVSVLRRMDDLYYDADKAQSIAEWDVIGIQQQRAQIEKKACCNL